jgi:hypothetical protein
MEIIIIAMLTTITIFLGLIAGILFSLSSSLGTVIGLLESRREDR